MSRYIVKTKNGFVGRMDVTEPLTGDQLRAFAYTYDDYDEADAVAQRFGGIVEVV